MTGLATTGLDRLTSPTILAVVGLVVVLVGCTAAVPTADSEPSPASSTGMDGLASATSNRNDSNRNDSNRIDSTIWSPPRDEPRLGDHPAEGPVLRSLPPARGIPVAEPTVRQPVRIRIDDLGIGAAPVTPVGVEADGELQVPGASEVGWYRFGSAPGEAGSSVLAAHVAYDGEDGVFRHLADLAPGAMVEVELDDGTSHTYSITETRLVDKAALPFEEVFSEAGPDRLVLITCGGRFDPSIKSYEGNVVAYAKPNRPTRE